MKQVKIRLNDEYTVIVKSGQKLIDVLQGASEVTSLCHHPKFKSKENCDLCYVEVQYALEDKPYLRKSCQIVVNEEMHVWTHTSRLNLFRSACLSVLIASFPSNLLKGAKSLSQKLARMRQQTESEFVDLGSGGGPIEASKRQTRRWAEDLEFSPGLCVECGLCLSYEQHFSEEPVLKMSVDTGGEVELYPDGGITPSITKGLSLVCPTSALTHHLAHQVKTPLSFPPGFKAIVNDIDIHCSFENSTLSISPRSWDRPLENDVFAKLDRYLKGEVLEKVINSNVMTAPPSQVCWLLCGDVDQETQNFLKRSISTFRQRVLSFDQKNEIRLESHPLAIPTEKMAGILILGPEDVIDPRSVELSPVPITGVFLSRRSQWKGPEMESVSNLFFAPISDYLEGQLDERGQRHIAHGMKRLGL